MDKASTVKFLLRPNLYMDRYDGVLAFCGTHDVEEKPILLCSCKGDGVSIFDLPMHAKRGRIYSRHDVRAVQVGPDGLFFAGDAASLVYVREPNGRICQQTETRKRSK